MGKDQPVWKFKTASYLFTIVVGILFAFLNYQISTLPEPNDGNSFGLILSIIVPIVAIWLIATHAAVNLKSYAYSIQASKDGKGLMYIADGFIYLVIYTMLLPMYNSIESLALHTRFLNAAVVFGNFVPLIVLSYSVYLFYQGSKRLVSIVKTKPKNTLLTKILVVIGCVLFVAFLWKFYVAVPTLKAVNGIPKFILPVQLLLFIYAIPNVLLWAYGLVAVRNLAHYGNEIAGEVYRPLFKNVCRGIRMVYLAIFISQVFVVSNVSYKSFNLAIGLIYGLLILSCIGYILTAHGAKNLTRIEDAE